MSNLLFALWIGLSAGLLLLFFYAAFLNIRRNRQSRQVELGELIPSFLPVNVEALSQLLECTENAPDPSRSGEEVRELQRKQISEARECLKRMTRNAALLQRLGYAQLRSGNELICSLAQEMIDAGVHVRFYTFLGLVTLYVWSALRLTRRPMLPAPKLSELQTMLSTSLIPSYELLKDKAGNITCLKFSGYHEALVASL